MDRDPETVSDILARVGTGDEQARRELFEVAYDELRAMAGRAMAHEPRGDLLQTTALVHEAYLKLTKGQRIPADNRRHFFGAAARAMRQILVDASRKKRAENESWLDYAVEQRKSKVDLVALDDALEKLARHRRAQGGHRESSLLFADDDRRDGSGRRSRPSNCQA